MIRHIGPRLIENSLAFIFRKGTLFKLKHAKKARMTTYLAEWWEMLGDYTPELKRLLLLSELYLQLF
jgi:hypothetical protein